MLAVFFYIKKTMITIIFAPPRTGKTAFMTYILSRYAFDKSRNDLMRREIELKQANGFNAIKTIPKCCVSANYDLCFKKYGYTPRVNRRINPFCLGFANSLVKTHFNFPYEVIGITEAQKYLNSRMSTYFPEWQSRWYEQHGHNNLDIFMDTQRPMLIDVNIRELAQFIEILKMDIFYDKNNKVKRIKWRIRKIPNSFLFDRYMSSGKKDKSCYTEILVVSYENTLEFYNSQSCKPKFYDGHFNEDFDIVESEYTPETLEAYTAHIQKFDDELPDGYYMSRKLQKGLKK